MTEHGEFRENRICTEPEWAGYTSETCEMADPFSNGAYDLVC